MKIICPKCSMLIQSENMNFEENICFCLNCKNYFLLSYLLSSEEIEKIERVFNNPPKYIKIIKNNKTTRVRVYLRSISHLTFFAFIFSLVTLFSFIGLSGTQIFRKELDFNNLFSSMVWIMFLCYSMWLIYRSLYSAFGRIEFAFGIRNYIFQGFWIIGIKKNIDWKNIRDFYKYYLLADAGDMGLVKTDYINIKENKIIKISLDKLEEKSEFLLSIIKYFRYKTIK